MDFCFSFFFFSRDPRQQAALWAANRVAFTVKIVGEELQGHVCACVCTLCCPAQIHSWEQWSADGAGGGGGCAHIYAYTLAPHTRFPLNY